MKDKIFIYLILALCFVYLAVVVSSYIFIPATRIDYIFGITHKIIDDINANLDYNVPVETAHNCVKSLEKIYLISLDFNYWIAVALNSWWFLVILFVILFIYIRSRKDTKELSYI